MDRGTFSDMSLDMIAFSILRNLIEKDDEYCKMDSEGFVPTNLTYLTEFATLFFKTFSNVDLTPLFTYYLNRMKEGNNFYEVF